MNKIILGIFFLLLQIGDIITTYIGIKMGGEEGNPLMRKLVKIGFPYFVILKLSLSAFVIFFLSFNINFIFYLFLIINIILLIIFIWNIYIIITTKMIKNGSSEQNK